MTVYYDRHGVTVLHGDSLDRLAELADGSVDVVITDPPYGIRFMGQAWDGEDITTGIVRRRGQAPVPHDGKAGATGGYQSAAAEAGRYEQTSSANRAFQDWCELWARECLRVLKPGGHLAAFGGTRTFHRLTAGIEDAGFEVRDSIGVAGWVYGSGFPKSMDVSKALDKLAGAEREIAGRNPRAAQQTAKRGTASFGDYAGTSEFLTTPATDAAREWEGWGTALKPAWEPIVLARKPLAGTVAQTVLAHGTGALNIDACRTAHRDAADRAESEQKNRHAQFGTAPGGNYVYGDYSTTDVRDYDGSAGRWPTNTVLVHHPDCGPDGEPGACAPDCPAAELDAQSGVGRRGERPANRTGIGYGDAHRSGTAGAREPLAAGGASRFFPCFRWEAKAPPAERPRVDGIAHPTVKPVALMRWLVRLLTPPGGLVLDPFAGSGTTGQAARAEGRRAVLVEREADYLPLIRARLDARQRTDRPALPTPRPDVDEPTDLLDLLAEGAAS